MNTSGSDGGSPQGLPAKRASRSVSVSSWSAEQYHAKASAEVSINFCDLVFSQQRLGAGAFGQVRRGTYKGKPVAIKELFRECQTQESMRAFGREVTVLSNLRHINVIGFVGAVVDPQNPCIALELAKESVLDILLDMSREFPHNQVAAVALDVVRGLLYLHSQQPPILYVVGVGMRNQHSFFFFFFFFFSTACLAVMQLHSRIASYLIFGC